MADPVQTALEVAHSGPIHGSTPGRVDTIEMSVPGESFIVPADVVSALGEGNTHAGFKVLGQMFPAPPQGRAMGGPVPIITAAGEYAVHPSHVQRVGGGDFKKGHEALRDFVSIVRAKHIKTLQRLPKPVRG